MKTLLESSCYLLLWWYKTDTFSEISIFYHQKLGEMINVHNLSAASLQHYKLLNWTNVMVSAWWVVWFYDLRELGFFSWNTCRNFHEWKRKPKLVMISFLESYKMLTYLINFAFFIRKNDVKPSTRSSVQWSVVQWGSTMNC